MIVQALYNALTQAMSRRINAVVRGALMNKIEGETYNLIEEMMINNCRWSNERTLPKKAIGKFNVDALTCLLLKLTS
mgnify:CR=1 FL=1